MVCGCKRLKLKLLDYFNNMGTTWHSGPNPLTPRCPPLPRFESRRAIFYRRVAPQQPPAATLLGSPLLSVRDTPPEVGLQVRLGVQVVVVLLINLKLPCERPLWVGMGCAKSHRNPDVSGCSGSPGVPEGRA